MSYVNLHAALRRDFSYRQWPRIRYIYIFIYPAISDVRAVTLVVVTAGAARTVQMSKQAGDLAKSRPSDAGQRGPKRLLDDKDFWKIYEKGETIGRGHFAKVKLVRHRRRRDLRAPAQTAALGPRDPCEGSPCGPTRHPCASRRLRPSRPAARLVRKPQRKTSAEPCCASTTPAPTWQWRFFCGEDPG